jgi:hypothetical protein
MKLKDKVAIITGAVAPQGLEKAIADGTPNPARKLSSSAAATGINCMSRGGEMKRRPESAAVSACAYFQLTSALHVQSSRCCSQFSPITRVCYSYR